MSRFVAAVSVVVAFGGASCSAGGGDTIPPTEPGAVSPASTTRPADPLVVPVSFPADGITIEGDLYLPQGGGPHPGIVLIHGSGPQSREERLPGQLNLQFGFSIPVFTQLAEQLRAAGYATLVYDKRTCGTFNNCAQNGYPVPSDGLTVEAFVADATAALAYLKDRPEVDAERVAVAGHSQGGQFVPQMLTEQAGAVAGVLLATPHDPPDALVADQAASTRELLAGLGMAPDQIDEAAAPLFSAADALARIRAGETVATPILGASGAFWASWMTYADGVPTVAANLERPVLVLSGELDWNVPPTQTARWEGTLPSERGHVIVVLPCITHALNCLAEANPSAITPTDIGRSVDPNVAAEMVAFLDTATDRP